MQQYNRKILLRERKRHTARRVASDLLGEGHPPWTWGGVPTLDGGKGVPTLGYPSPRPDMAGGGVPTFDRGPTLGYSSPILTLAGGRGYLPWTGGGYLP